MVKASSPTMQQKWERNDGDDDAPKPRMVNPASSGMRRSCDPCGRRKKKCDRELPCRRCQQTGDECTYSKRRWHIPHLQQPRKNRQLAKVQLDPHKAHAVQVLQHSTSSAISRHDGVLPFKRCKLSASPATGLVGMRENSFLKDFFGCVGFVPLTTQSNIRETMVKIMLYPASGERQVFGDGRDEAGQGDGRVSRGALGNALGREKLPVGPSICIFWCAVALGALVKGSPIDSVAIYTRRATDALAQSQSGPADAEVAQAWTNLAYLYGFMGDSAKFEEYLSLSEACLNATIQQGSTDKLPVGFAEIIQDRGKPETSSNMESFCSREYELPQLNGVYSEHEVYRYVQQSFRVFQRALYSKVLNNSPSETGSLFGAESDAEGDGDIPQHITDAMASVWFEDNLVRFEALDDIVDRPSIRAGVGGMIINGCMGFQAANEGDTQLTLKRFSRCVEVFVRYPGLCRFPWLGVHKAHTMMVGLAALDIPGAREEYEKLRAAFNSARPHGFPPAPPLEEWQGLSAICDDVHCRALEGLIASDHLSAFSTTHDGSCPNENDEIKGEECFNLAVVTQHGQPVTSIVRSQETFCPASCPSGSSETVSDLFGSFSGNGGTEHCSESTDVDEAPTDSATLPNCYHSEVNLDDDDAGSNIDVVCAGDGAEFSVSGMVATPGEATLVMPEGLGAGAVDGIEEDDIGAGDWLDVTDALLAGSNESGQACC